ncbi:pectinesterase inhibitor 11-like [Malania oleifera]|uniref:pectinesterase inhibitor 11-like n=1 Tax=Malania oleifera TaxID=397392 RepID=UPI0025ADFDFF|nr:pectinesterase inhibitor 11-like [Malania oleifera]
MAKATSSLPLLLLLSIFCVAAAAASVSAHTPSKSSNSFILGSCRETRYPALCLKSLLPYASAIQTSPQKLAQTALSLSLNQANSTKAFVSKMNKIKGQKKLVQEALKDCLDEMEDSMGRLGQSIQELRSLGRASSPNFQWHLSNVQTWVSAALTDDNTCIDGLAGPAYTENVKKEVKFRVANAARATSNALALINRLGGDQ